MAMPSWLPEAWSKLNADNQKQASNFLQFLLSQQNGEAEIQKTPRKERRLGILADRFISMSDDFNEPIEDFKEYL